MKYVKMKGVSPATKKNGEIYYRSSLTFRGKHISLGSFSTCEEANICYQEGLTILNQDVKITDFTTQSCLSFEKWVSLINFRDNGMYFKTPIYLKNKYFYYYLNLTELLKFSMDDLFFYSSHTIQKRGSHLFVADYGMQMNLSNRYGIKNFAVKDRDYRFLNGDPLDFRYENIEIINHYAGVTQFERNGFLKFKAFIHINGNYVIGVYNTEEEAAIAYNKAIDILKKKGLTKNYTVNYVDNVSSQRYAEIYTNCKISQKILDYTPS